MVFLECLFDGMLGWVGWVVVFMFFVSVDLVVCKFCDDLILWGMMCKFVFSLMFEGIK